jgi:glycosyltransferase involved in cell wall biosynthesis
VFVFDRYIRDDEVPVFFSAADVCVLPYKSATQSGITAISHHFDLPLIATDVGGLKEKVIHEKNGLIVKEANSSQLAQTIRHYFDSDMKNGFSQEIMCEKEQNSWENFTEKIINFSKTL